MWITLSRILSMLSVVSGLTRRDDQAVLHRRADAHEQRIGRSRGMVLEQEVHVGAVVDPIRD